MEKDNKIKLWWIVDQDDETMIRSTKLFEATEEQANIWLRVAWKGFTVKVKEARFMNLSDVEFSDKITLDKSTGVFLDRGIHAKFIIKKGKFLAYCYNEKEYCIELDVEDLKKLGYYGK